MVEICIHNLSSVPFKRTAKYTVKFECVCHRGDIIFTFCVDYGIIWCPQKEGIDKFLPDIQNKEKTKKKFDIKDRGDISDCLGISLEVIDVKASYHNHNQLNK